MISLGLGLWSTTILSRLGFSPSALFANGEVGVWYDPSPETTFTDTAGTTPATVGDAVALMLDKSKGLVLGPELVTLLDGWTASNATLSEVDGSLVITSSSSGTVYITKNFSNVGGSTYRSSSVVSGGAATVNTYRIAPFTNFMFSLRTDGTPLLAASTDTDTTAGVTLFWTAGAAGETRTLESITIRELPGYHATQATTAARPILARVPARGRANLLTRTEEFDNAAWLKLRATVNSLGELTDDATNGQHCVRQDITKPAIAAQYTMFFDVEAGSRNFCYLQAQEGSNFCRQYFNISTGAVGTGQSSGLTLNSADIEDMGNGVYRCKMTFTSGTGTSLLNYLVAANADNAPAYAGNSDVALRVYKSQLELGTTASAYQKVTSTYDVTEAGQADNYFLWFDGIDDSMVTPSIDFTGTDEMSVFAGVRKLSDDAAGIVAELSVTGASAGIFAAYCSGLTGDASRRTWGGSLLASSNLLTTTAQVFAAPDTRVYTLILNSSEVASENKLRMRLNALPQTLAVSGSTSTGNFGNYPMYIGSRGGATLRFNGHIYNLLVRGALTEGNTLTQTEKYVSTKTAGVDLT